MPGGRTAASRERGCAAVIAGPPLGVRGRPRPAICTPGAIPTAGGLDLRGSDPRGPDPRGTRSGLERKYLIWVVRRSGGSGDEAGRERVGSGHIRRTRRTTRAPTRGPAGCPPGPRRRQPPRTQPPRTQPPGTAASPGRSRPWLSLPARPGDRHGSAWRQAGRYGGGRPRRHRAVHAGGAVRGERPSGRGPGPVGRAPGRPRSLHHRRQRGRRHRRHHGGQEHARSPARALRRSWDGDRRAGRPAPGRPDDPPRSGAVLPGGRADKRGRLQPLRRYVQARRWPSARRSGSPTASSRW